MNRILAAVLLGASATTAMAADLPVPGPLPPPVPYVYPAYNWSGFYLGINGGYAFGSSTTSGALSSPVVVNGTTIAAGTPISSSSFNTGGVLLGATAGGNWQFSSFVIGAEGDLGFTNLRGSTTSTSLNIPCTGCSIQATSLGTIRARAGFAWDRFLFYGTGGLAYGQLEAGASANGWNVGWTAGAGVEGCHYRSLDREIEYLYVDLGSAPCTNRKLHNQRQRQSNRKYYKSRRRISKFPPIKNRDETGLRRCRTLRNSRILKLRRLSEANKLRDLIPHNPAGSNALNE